MQLPPISSTAQSTSAAENLINLTRIFSAKARKEALPWVQLHIWCKLQCSKIMPQSN
jgi:hypothetical protein